MKKGFKVTDVAREKKFGVAAGSLVELIEKSCKKFGANVSCAGWRVCVAEDGTRVEDDDYLKTLPPQTLLVMLKSDETMVNDFEYYYNAIRSSKREFIDTGNAAKEFLNTDMAEKFKVFQRYIAAADDARTMLSERTQDPDWFIGLDPSEKNKEQSMSRRVRDRMRGYYYKTKTALQSSDIYCHSKKGLGKKLIEQFLEDLRNILDAQGYNYTYFNRKSHDTNKLCNESGLFKCGGLWNQPGCLYDGEHVINPYRSREERIIFQTWNLDHNIELSRSIIPKIIETVGKIIASDITCAMCCKFTKSGILDSERYYLLIFTTINLKLVHIVCHHKGKHVGKESELYALCKKCTAMTNVNIEY